MIFYTVVILLFKFHLRKLRMKRDIKWFAILNFESNLTFFKVNIYSTVCQRWNRSGFSRPDPTGKFQNHRRSTGF